MSVFVELHLKRRQAQHLVVALNLPEVWHRRGVEGEAFIDAAEPEKQKDGEGYLASFHSPKPLPKPLPRAGRLADQLRHGTPILSL
jgi:hypothetical protein